MRLLLTSVPPADRLLLVPAAVRDSPEFAEHLADVETAVVELPSERREAIATGLSAARAAGARLVVPDGDKNVAPLLLALARARGTHPPVSVLLMRTSLPGGPERATPGMTVKPPLAFLLARVPRVRVRFLTDAFGVVVRRRGFPGIEPVRDPVTVPGPVARPDDARPDDAGGPAGFRLGVFGVVSARKNVPLLLEALEQLPDVHLVVGGRCEPDVRTALEESPLADRLHVDDRLLSEAEFDAAVSGADAVAVLHDNDAPSGIVAEAAARGVPVLGPARGWAASMVTGTGIGEVAELGATDPVAEVRAAIARLVAHRDRRAAAAHRARTRLGTDHFVTGLIGDAR
ncbi:glycosyltransferase family protein [Actinomycetospora atypica]|uniref:Spore protein YkvP/CgeB glycosyl transferase-like domain-containing protein n=1 Tax=Actinomycetospora atypica TaxID=1290095 RepID=A0ABV9YJZ2_9PSEU